MTKMLSELDNLKYRLNDYSEIERIEDRVGKKEFSHYLDWVADRLLSMEGNDPVHAQWVDIGPFVVRPNLLPVFIKAACLVIGCISRRGDSWEFNDTYTAIRRITEKTLPEQKMHLL